MSHIHEKIDFVVSAYIISRERVLLAHHKEHRMWLPVGGHVELNEDPEEALFREIEEESGFKHEDIEILAEKPAVSFLRNKKVLYAPLFLDIHDINETHRHVNMSYAARATHDAVILSETEHHAIRWFTKEDLRDPLFGIPEDVRYFAERAMEIARSSPPLS